MISVVIPVFNEEELLEESVRRVAAHLAQLAVPFEVLAISNGSTDRTNEIGPKLQATMPEFRFFQLDERGGGRAFIRGVRESRGDVIVTLDIDLSSGLNFLNYASELMKFGDMVIGSKTFGSQRRTFMRVFGSYTYIIFTQLLLDMTITDYSMGYKAFRREQILPALEHLDPWTGYIFELALFLNLKGKSLIQIGIDCNDTRPSRFNIWHEGYYRFRHLAKCWRMVKDRSSWFYRV